MTSKINKTRLGKRIPIFLVLLFGVIILSSSFALISFSQVQNISAISETNSKIDNSLLEKINEKIANIETKTSQSLSIPDTDKFHNVIIFVNKYPDKINPDDFIINPAIQQNEEPGIVTEFFGDPKILIAGATIAQQNKESLADVLTESIGATNVSKAKHLSFVTAKIPVQQLNQIADLDYVFRIGDGEKILELELDVSRPSISAENLVFNGTGTIVSVIDTTIRQFHTDMPNNTKIIRQATCTPTGCTDGATPPTDQHGTHVAGIIAGLGIIDNDLRGIASGAQLLNPRVTDATQFAHAVDWSIDNGAKIINLSQGYPTDQSCGADIENLVVDEAVDEGVVFVKSAGNFGDDNGTPRFESITDPGCSFNVMTVGNIDDDNTATRSDDILALGSSKGPTFDGRLKPEIVAPGTLINSTDLEMDYEPVNGTSFAAPHVSGTAALILEAQPQFTPLEIKAALLLGADWNPTNNSTISKTASEYENGGSTDQILNQFGFGYLNATQSLTYANSGTNVLRGTVDEFESRNYSFSANQDEQVKVILSWLKHPGGSILSPQNVTVSNLDFVIKQPDGSTVTSNSTLQNNEFAVFDANMTGAYTITVSAPIVSPASAFTETFALASTHSLQVGTFFVKEGTFTKALPGTIPQLSRPTADISVGGWTTTPLYQKLDEATPDDSDFVTSPTGTSPEFEVGLTNIIDPLSDTDHIIKFRAFASDGGGAKEKANAVLLEGTNEIAETGLQNLSRSGFTQFEYTLSAAEADDITDYTNLSIRIETSKGNSEEIQVSWMEFEVPSQPSQQSINVGFKPKALILFTTGQTAEGSTDAYKFSMGYSNGTDSRSIGVASDDDGTKANAGRTFGTKVLSILASGTPDVSAEADLVGFGSNNFTIKWTTNDSILSNIHYIALGGDDLTNTKVSSFAAQTTTGNQIVTVGFKPDFLMFMHAASTTETSSATNGYISYGFAKSSTQRGAIAVTSEDARATMDTWNYQRADRSIVMLNDRTGVIDAEADFASMNTDGFTINWIDAPSDSDRIYYLALKGGSYEVGNFDKTTSSSPTTQTITTLGIIPKALILSSTNDVTTTVVQSNNRLSFGASDGVSESAVWVGDQDAASDSITARSNTATKIIRLATEAATGSSSTINAEADLQSFNSNGFSLNWTTNDSEAKQILYVAFGNFDLASGLVGYWKLDENTGLVATDTSGKNNTGTLINGPTWLSGSSCHDNSCLSFDGINDHVSVPDSDTLEGMTELTVSAWVKRDVLANATDWVIGKSTEPNTFNSGSYDISVSSNEGFSGITMTIFIQDLVRCSTTIATYPHDTNFHHTVLLYKSGTPMLMYVDGVSTVSGCNFSGPINNSTYLVTFASQDSPTDPNYLPGTIDDVRIYERALTDAEIQELFQMGT